MINGIDKKNQRQVGSICDLIDFLPLAIINFICQTYEREYKQKYNISHNQKTHPQHLLHNSLQLNFSLHNKHKNPSSYQQQQQQRQNMQNKIFFNPQDYQYRSQYQSQSYLSQAPSSISIFQHSSSSINKHKSISSIIVSGKQQLQSYQLHHKHQDYSRDYSCNCDSHGGYGYGYGYSTKQMLNDGQSSKDESSRGEYRNGSRLKIKIKQSGNIQQSLIQSQSEGLHEKYGQKQKQKQKQQKMIDENQNTEQYHQENKDKNTNSNNMKKKNKYQQILNTFIKIKQWRQAHTAPVDTVGCEQLYDKNQPQLIQKYQILIALILSVQTKDQITAKIVQRLKLHGLDPDKISSIKQQKLLELIHESNFNRKKVKNIIEITKQIKQNQNKIPKTMEGLLEYPGVGIKIATLYLKIAQNINEGIGVDTHVHRIVNRLGWVRNAKNPNQTEKQLRNLFEKEHWNEINVVLVGFGQTLCGAKKPKCSECPVKRECPSRMGSGLDF